MRILFVTNRYPTKEMQGSSPCIKEQRQAIQQLGHEVDLLLIHSEQSILNYLKAMWDVFCTIQLGNSYDLVHAHYGYCGIVARMQFRCPIIVTYRGSDILSKRERSVNSLLARLADRTIVMTEEMKSLLGRDDAYVIPYGVALDLFKPRPLLEARRELGLPSNVPLVLFPYDQKRLLKRFDLVEQAVAFARRELPDIRLLVVHDRPPETVVAYMNACDAMVLASDREGAPMTVREAMACNLPIVSVDVGDVASVIGGTDLCYVVNRDPQDIAEKLVRVLRARKRTNGRSAVEKMSTSCSAASVVGVYDSLLQEAGDGGPEDPTPEIDP